MVSVNGWRFTRNPGELVFASGTSILRSALARHAAWGRRLGSGVMSLDPERYVLSPKPPRPDPLSEVSSKSSRKVANKGKLAADASALTCSC